MFYDKGPCGGATTLDITATSIKTFTITTSSTMGLIAALSINSTQHNVMPSVVVPSVVWLNVVMLCVVRLNVVMLNVVMLSVVMLSVVMLSVVRLNV
jgi:hypothetical protein